VPLRRRYAMGKASREQSGTIERLPGYEGRFTEIGPMTVQFETYTEDADLAPLFRGLPNDSCQAMHCGYVIRGRLSFRNTDGTIEEFNAGDAYVVTAGHTPILTAGTEVIEFTPTDELQATVAAVAANMAAAEVPGT
jgi:hypothetical protein